MAKQTTSLGSLVNLADLNKLVKKADVLIVGRDSGMTYICNGHWIVRVRLPEDAAVRATIFSRLGAFPDDGTALECRNKGSLPYSLANLKKFFADPFYAVCTDTHLSHDLGDKEVRVFDCNDQGQRCYIGIDRVYFSMLNQYARAASQKCAKSSAILFTANYDEAALILPVNYTGNDYLSRV